jgi:uncharacterized protein YlxW (UPF0749 family)
MKEAKDVERAKRKLEDLLQQMEDLQAELEQEIEEIKAEFDSLTEEVEISELKPKKSDVSVSLVALAWVPFWQNEKGGIEPAF